jgi:hypothetical protein
MGSVTAVTVFFTVLVAAALVLAVTLLGVLAGLSVSRRRAGSETTSTSRSAVDSRVQPVRVPAGHRRTAHQH